MCVHAVETLSCSVVQPVCNGKKSNAQKKTAVGTTAPKLGEKSTPTNAATSSATSGSTNSTSGAISPSALSASSALYVAALTVVLAAVVA